MDAYRTIWPSVETELRVFAQHADKLAQERLALYVVDGVFSFCFPLSPEAARALAAELLAGADKLQPIA